MLAELFVLITRLTLALDRVDAVVAGWGASTAPLLTAPGFRGHAAAPRGLT